MIEELKQSIAETLKTVSNVLVYDEEVPQGFTIPSWMISIYLQTPSKGINTRRKNTVYVDVSYFPEDDVNSETECQNIAELLSRVDVMGNTVKFKVTNRNISTTDKVLHFEFETSYREIPVSQLAKMHEMEKTEIIKEN